MLGKIYNDQTGRYENHDKQVLEYYELGTLEGAPSIKVFYDDGSVHYINLDNGVLTAGDDLAFTGHPGVDANTTNSVVMTADGTYSLAAIGGNDGSFVIAGNFGSGTAQLKYSVMDVAVDYTSGAFTSNGGVALRWASDLNQIVLTGSTSPSLTAIAYY